MEINIIAGALAKAQAKFVQPEKNKTVTVRPKDGKQPYSFDYADYNAIVEAVRGPLSENEICFTHYVTLTERGTVLVTRLIHSSGQFLECLWPMGGSNEPKEIGGDITYGKRYCLSALTGCVADDDADADIANTTEFKDRKPQAQLKPAGPSPVKPVSQPKPPVEGSFEDFDQTPNDGLTPKMRALLFARAGERGWNEGQIKGLMEIRCGIKSTKDLTREQFSELLDVIETKTFGQACMGTREPGQEG